MNAEQLILKGVKHRQQKGCLVLDVVSLNEHFDGLLIHKTDIMVLEEGELVNEYVKLGDVNFDNAIAKEVEKVAKTVQETTVGMTYAEAEALLKEGKLVKLPEWKGFWFQNLTNGQVLVLTAEGEILDTPWDICKESNDWIEAQATPEQAALLESYFDALSNPSTPGVQIEAVVTEENAVEEPVAATQPEPVAETQVAETPKKRSTKKTEE